MRVSGIEGFDKHSPELLGGRRRKNSRKNHSKKFNSRNKNRNRSLKIKI
jgi:hypothetical protein